MSSVRSISFTLIAAGFLASVAVGPGQEVESYPAQGSAWERWLTKPVRERRLLDDMEFPGNWTHLGAGALEWTSVRFMDGRQSLRLRAPVRPEAIRPAHSSAPFGQAVVRRLFEGEDWSAYNRVALHVYPHESGASATRLKLRLLNRDIEAVHWVSLRPEVWNHVVWEIPHLARDHIDAFDVVYYQQGREPDATSVVAFDVDRLELQAVEADPFQGWAVRPDRLAYCQAGYRADSAKVIVASGLNATQFKLVRLPSGGEQALPIQVTRSALGRFQLLDFSATRVPGQYLVRAGGLSTAPFSIGEDIWHTTAERILNGFLCRRCGVDVPGAHRRCHLDWQATRDDQTLAVHGGWHPSDHPPRDLQSTAEAVLAMIQLAARYQSTDSILANRLIQEARWGLEWLLKTRFQDGMRVQRPPLQIWSDNELGTADDPPALLTGAPVDIYFAAAAGAAVARALTEGDPALATRSLEMAKLDWETARAASAAMDLELAAAGTQASLELFRATGEQLYANAAVEFAKTIVGCQERAWQDWSKPMTGFFYASLDREQPFEDQSERELAHTPAVALAGLCQLFPNHERWMEWYSALALYSDYLRDTADLSPPWKLLPATLYAPDPLFEGGKGLKLDNRHSLKRLPRQGTGQLPALLAKAKALSTAAHIRRDPGLLSLAERQMQWVAGWNPFGQSLIAGVGQDYPPLHDFLSGDYVGALPAGMESHPTNDVPYWPASTAPRAKGVTLLASARWLSMLVDLDGEATVTGPVAPGGGRASELTEVSTGLRYPIPKPEQGNRFNVRVPAGRYRAGPPEAALNWTFLPGRTTEVDLANPLAFAVSAQETTPGTLQLTLRAYGRGQHRFQVRAHNLQVDQPEQEIVFGVLGVRSLKWTARILASEEPWVIVVVPDRDVGRRLELVGSKRPRSRS